LFRLFFIAVNSCPESKSILKKNYKNRREEKGKRINGSALVSDGLAAQQPISTSLGNHGYCYREHANNSSSSSSSSSSNNNITTMVE